MQEPNLIILITLLAVLLFAGSGVSVGVARHKYGVKAPAMTGHDVFERHVRAQMNTLEQLVIFLPGLWLFGFYWGGLVASGLGVLWLIARVLYIVLYVRRPDKRGLAFTTGTLINAVLVIGGLAGAVREIVTTGVF